MTDRIIVIYAMKHYTPIVEVTHPESHTSFAYRAGNYQAQAEWLAEYAKTLLKEIEELEAKVAKLQSK